MEMLGWPARSASIGELGGYGSDSPPPRSAEPLNLLAAYVWTVDKLLTDVTLSRRSASLSPRASRQLRGVSRPSQRQQSTIRRQAHPERNHTICNPSAMKAPRQRVALSILFPQSSGIARQPVQTEGKGEVSYRHRRWRRKGWSYRRVGWGRRWYPASAWVMGATIALPIMAVVATNRAAATLWSNADRASRIVIAAVVAIMIAGLIL